MSEIVKQERDEPEAKIQEQYGPSPLASIYLIFKYWSDPSFRDRVDRRLNDEEGVSDV